MKVVIDTNIVIKMIRPNSPCFWIRKALERQQLTLCVTTDILEEYEEILSEFYDQRTVDLFFDVLDLLPNVQFVSKYFFFRLIPQDQDDEKFVDCAIATNTHYLVTNDKHFNPLKKLPFPVIQIVNENEFRDIFEEYLGAKM